MARKFYKYLFSIEVLSEDPLPDMDLEDVAYNIKDGECSGGTLQRIEEVVDGPTMAQLLVAQGSDPGFFNLDAEGNDLDEEEEIDPAIRRQMEGYEHDDN